jgi:hypothetical protein
MQDIAFALLFMSISAFVAIALAGKVGHSKVLIYALGLAVMLLQIAVLFTFRGLEPPQREAGPKAHSLFAIGVSPTSQVRVIKTSF